MKGKNEETERLTCMSFNYLHCFIETQDVEVSKPCQDVSASLFLCLQAPYHIHRFYLGHADNL